MKKLMICLPILLIFYGCGGSNNIQYPEPSSTSRDGSFYSKAGTYEFGDKEYLADFGTVTVPENRESEIKAHSSASASNSCMEAKFK